NAKPADKHKSAAAAMKPQRFCVRARAVRRAESSRKLTASMIRSRSASGSSATGTTMRPMLSSTFSTRRLRSVMRHLRAARQAISELFAPTHEPRLRGRNRNVEQHGDLRQLLAEHVVQHEHFGALGAHRREFAAHALELVPREHFALDIAFVRDFRA